MVALVDLLEPFGTADSQNLGCREPGRQVVQFAHCFLLGAAVRDLCQPRHQLYAGLTIDHFTTHTKASDVLRRAGHEWPPLRTQDGHDVGKRRLDGRRYLVTASWVMVAPSATECRTPFGE
jgi:hypothetical protein